MPVVEYERYSLQEDTSLVTVIGKTFDQLVLNCHENVLLEARLLAPLQLLPSMVVLRNLSQSRSRSLIAMFSIQPHMYVHLIREPDSIFYTMKHLDLILCTAKVTGIQQNDGWCYIGCLIILATKWDLLMLWLSSALNCLFRIFYRVALSLSDHTDSAAFLAFDMEVAKLTNIQASEAAQIVVDTDFPQSLADIVGNTYTFQLKVTEFNFTSNHKTFTISRIFPQRKLAPMPASVVNVCLFHCFEFDLTRNLKHAPSFGYSIITIYRSISKDNHFFCLIILTKQLICCALVWFSDCFYSEELHSIDMDTPTLEDAFDRLKSFCDRHSISGEPPLKGVNGVNEAPHSKMSMRTNLYRDGMLVPMLTEAGAISAKAGTTSA
ncbi:LOW QUALITY PROTEIN: hypothetical protein HID58_056552 [Brassica napus]|uniref:Uncharacterized protein n=1 Tax=Brassica napus TaxID=3708 RepID=A0ABQ8ANS3_BRANA|nr:LOW QUALITY PROTEIN: hypothetical protein HID58_056552 [Brassica napus]